jgi:hypothetical protein
LWHHVFDYDVMLHNALKPFRFETSKENVTRTVLNGLIPPAGHLRW